MAGIGIRITADDAALRRGFERLSRLAADTRRPFGEIGLHVRRRAQRELRARKSPWGPTLGKLSKSLAMRVDPKFVIVGSPLVYAAIQQRGGPVRPGPGRKYLAIPVQATLRRRGVWPRDLPKDSMRFVPDAQINVGGRSWIGPALVRAQITESPRMRTTKKGETKQARPKQKIGEVMFALIKHANIKGRPYLLFDAEEQAFAVQALRRAFLRAIRGGGAAGAGG